MSKSEVMELLEKYDIGFITVDEEYLEEEFNAFKKMSNFSVRDNFLQ